MRPVGDATADARSDAELGNWRRTENNAAQFINTLGLVEPSEANGEIDMPAASERTPLQQA